MGSWLWEVGIRAEGLRGVGGVLVNLRTSLKVKTNCRFEKFKAELKIIL